MVKAKVTVTERNPEAWNRLKKALPTLKTANVTVGLHEGAGAYEGGQDVVDVALWNEFGTESVPARSFFRSTIDENVDRIEVWRAKGLEDIIAGKATVQQVLKSIGFKVQVLIQNKIKSNVGPMNTVATKAAKIAKGSRNWDRTLMDTELMLRSVTFKVNVK